MKAPIHLGALTHKSLADILRRPVRSLLVILGIVVGVAGLTAINFADNMVSSALNYTADVTRAANITIYAKQIDPALLTKLAAVPNVTAAQLATSYATRWQIAQTPGHANLSITAYADLSHVTLNPFQITQGRLPGVGEIVMDTSDSTFQPIAVGDTVTVDSSHGPTVLRVVGLSRTLGAVSVGFTGSARGYMSAAGFDQLTGLTGPNIAQAQVRDVKQIDQTTGVLYNTLTQNHVVVQGYSTDDSPLGMGPLSGLFTIMRVLAVIALLLTAFLIINTVSTLVAEQIKIIGTMKAMGGTRGKIMRSYLLSVLCYGVVGTVLGVALGIVGGYQFAQFLANIIILDLGPFQFAPWILLVSVLIGVGIPLLAALVPLWTGTAITVRDAMAAYGISNTGKRARLDALAARLTWIPQTTWLGLRGIFRKRGRTALTLVALTLSGAAFLAIQTTTYSVSQTQAQITSLYPWDIRLSVSQPQPIATMTSTLLAMPNVAAVEDHNYDGVRTPWGIIMVEGFHPNTQMYHHVMTAGRWFAGDETSAIVISDLVASKTHLHVGDTLPLSLPTGTKVWTIIGIAHDPSGGLGVVGTTFVTTDALNTFNQQPTGEAGLFLIRAQNHATAAVNALATTLDSQLSAAGLAPSIVTAQQNVQRSQSQFQILYVLLYAVAAIVAIVGMLSLANTLTTSVLERRREIGILRSMGATSWRVSSVFWVEGLAMACIAWVIATIIGIPGAIGFLALISNVLLPIDFAFNPMMLLSMLVLIIVITTIASLGPALSASRARIATILRYE